MPPFKQVDGNKNILVREDGSVRKGLQNIEPEYERDEDGQIRTDRWPTVLVAGDSGGLDRRLLPAEVLKVHGALPLHGDYSHDDFAPKDGDHTNCAKDNIVYTPSEAGQPYKQRPEDKNEDKDTKDPAPEKEPAEKQPAPTGRTVPSVSPDEDGDDQPNESGNKIKVKSKDLNADEAREIIENNTYADLDAAGFFTEDEKANPRKTVIEAWEKKKEAAAE